MNSITEGNKDIGGSKTVMWAIMGIGVLVIAGLVTWMLMQPSQKGMVPRLENALREGPEFEELKKKIAIDPMRDFTTESRSLAGGLQMRLVGVVRNFTGKTLIGLEVIGSVVDREGKVIREKPVVVIPTLRPNLEPNKTTPVEVVIDGFSEKDDRNDIRWRVSALKVEE